MANSNPCIQVPLLPNAAVPAGKDPRQLLVDEDGDGRLECVNLDNAIAGYWSRRGELDMPDWGSLITSHLSHFLTGMT
jgi:hypothetical protein